MHSSVFQAVVDSNTGLRGEYSFHTTPLPFEAQLEQAALRVQRQIHLAKCERSPYWAICQPTIARIDPFAPGAPYDAPTTLFPDCRLKHLT